MENRNALMASLMIRPREQEAQLPCRVLLVGDYSGNLSGKSVEDIQQVEVNPDKPEQAMAELNCAIDFSGLMPEWQAAYSIRSLADFSPEMLIRQSPVLAEGIRLRDQLLSDNPDATLWGCARDYLSRYSDMEAQQLVDDFLYADLEVTLGNLLNQLLHYPPFARLESRWRQLFSLVESARYHQASQIVLLNMHKALLYEELSGAPVDQSDLFDRVYTQEFGQFGGQPYNLLVVDFYLEQTEQDIALATALGQIGRSAHLPVVLPVTPSFLGFKGYEQLLGQSLSEWFENPRFLPLHHLAQRPESRYLFFVLPDQVVRSPYQGDFSGLFFQEQLDADGECLLWGSSSVSLAAIMLNTFNTQSSFSQMTGSHFGRELLHLPYQDRLAGLSLSPLQISLSTSQVVDLSRHGFCVLTELPEVNSSYFAQLNSFYCLSLSDDSADPDAQLPFMLTVCRIAHMMKRVFREQIGSMDEPEQLRQKLEQWLKNFVVDLEAPALDVMMKKPFRAADVVLKREQGCLMEIRLQPHLRYMDERFQLSLDLILQESV